MNVAQNINENHKLPTQLRAVLIIINADQSLREKALVYINIERREIDWSMIFKNDLSSGQYAALVWAKALWLDIAQPKADPFDLAFSMDSNLRIAALKALMIRWGLA